MPRFTFLLALLALLLPVSAAAQAPGAIIEGRVTDATTGEPLVDAHVFIATSMIGTTTDADGRYRLERIPLGAQRLYASTLGYTNAAQDVMLREAKAYTFDFALDIDPFMLEEVTVEAEGDPNWQRRYERFKKLFIGETANAQELVVVNPEVLDFEEDLTTLKARAGEPIILENHALGYRILPQGLRSHHVPHPVRRRAVVRRDDARNARTRPRLGQSAPGCLLRLVPPLLACPAR